MEQWWILCPKNAKCENRDTVLLYGNRFLCPKNAKRENKDTLFTVRSHLLCPKNAKRENRDTLSLHGSRLLCPKNAQCENRDTLFGLRASSCVPKTRIVEKGTQLDLSCMPSQETIDFPLTRYYNLGTTIKQVLKRRIVVKSVHLVPIQKSVG